MRVLILILLLLTGCAGPQVSRLDANPLPPTDQYVEDVVHLLEVAAGTTSPERKAEAMAMLGDEELGRNFAYEARLKAEELKTRYDAVLLIETIGLFATYNPYVQQHRAELELDLCRTITPKVATGEIWLTAGNSNYESCLKDRQYVEAVVNNTLKGIHQYDSNEEQALQALLKRIPFTDIMAAVKNDANRVSSNQNNTPNQQKLNTSTLIYANNTFKANETDLKPHAKVYLRVHPEIYADIKSKIIYKLSGYTTIQFVETPNLANVWTLDIVLDSIKSGTYEYLADILTYQVDECNNSVAEQMEKDSEYSFYYKGSKGYWRFSGNLVISLNENMSTTPFSIEVPDIMIECSDFEIKIKDKYKPINEYANDQMETLCTKNKGTDRYNAFQYFSSALAKVIFDMKLHQYEK